MFSLSVFWDVSPQIVPFLPFRWYGMLFGLGFFLAYQLSIFLYKKENSPVEWVEKLFIYTLIATIIGARLGHVIFYDPAYYWEHPLEVLQVWQGGLASHGATIALLIALLIYSKKVTKKPYLWGVDRVVIVIALVACLIRFGNLFNSEIVGKPSDHPLAFGFVHPTKEIILTNMADKILEASYQKLDQDTTVEGIFYQKALLHLTIDKKWDKEEKLAIVKKEIVQIIDYFDKEQSHISLLKNTNPEFVFEKTPAKTTLSVPVWVKPRIPGQLLEGLFYLLVLGIVYFGFTRGNWRNKIGLTSGIFFMLVFGFRFFVEYFKEIQEPWEKNLPLNQGQMLSIPMILLGLIFVLLSLRKKT